MNREMRTWFFVGSFGLVTVLSLAAVARVAEAETIKEKDSVIYKKRTVIDFSDVTITGELQKPEGSYLLNRKKAKFPVLIRVRENFLPELLRSVDHI